MIATVASVKSFRPRLRDAAPSAASRARRARSCRRDSPRAGRAAGVRRLGGPDPRAATARPQARTAPRSTAVPDREVAEQVLPHQRSPRPDSIANLIPESNFQKIQHLMRRWREIAWRVSDRPDQIGVSAPACKGSRKNLESGCRAYARSPPGSLRPSRVCGIGAAHEVNKWVRPSEHSSLPSLVCESVADLKLHRQLTACGARCLWRWRGLLLGPLPRHSSTVRVRPAFSMGALC